MNTRKLYRSMSIMDDSFARLFFEDQNECVKHVLKCIMPEKNLTIIKTLNCKTIQAEQH